jgi:subtilisin family serine protease
VAELSVAEASQIKVTSTSGRSIAADAYLLGNGSEFSSDCARLEKLVGTPGSAAQAITVGSYDWNDGFEKFGRTYVQKDPVNGDRLKTGDLSTYSSPGPLRRGTNIKPDLAAPGQYFTAPASRNSHGFCDTTGYYQLFNGTSAATPYTAGVVALVMQAHPTITFGEIKELFRRSVSADQFTSAVPNPRWGYGKLNREAVTRVLLSAGAVPLRRP